MMRLAPVARLGAALELHRLDVRPGDDEVAPLTSRMVSVVIALPCPNPLPPRAAPLAVSTASRGQVTGGIFLSRTKNAS
jgi:hypothetical protein